MSHGQKLELTLAIIVLIAGVMLFIYSPTLVRGWAFSIPGTTDVALEPVFFPRLASVFVCLSALNLLITIPLRRIDLPAVTTKRIEYLKVILGLLGIFIYLLSVLFFGFVVSTVIFVTLMSYFGGYKNIAISFGVAVAVSLLLRLIFRYGLHVNLPQGLLF